MSSDADTALDLAKLLRVLRIYRWRWIVPTVALTALATAYALLHKPSWQAAQALVVRSEANVANEPPGKFRQAEDMRVSQETALAIARSRSVLSAALADVGPAPDATQTRNFPSAKDVAGLRKAVSMTAPKGAEFGTTEIFYLNVKDRDRQRAVDLSTAVCVELQKHFQELLDSKAKSVTAELERSVRLAQAELQKSTDRLGELEAGVGVDLAELRSISKLSSGGSGLQQTLATLDDQLRAAKVAEKSNGELLSLLRSVEQDSHKLLAMPSSLLDKLPALRRLKDGLVDAQLRTAQLLGAMSEAHPSVQGAMANESEVGQHIRRELPVAIHSIEAEQQLAQIKVRSLEQQIADVRQRSERLSALRAEHSRLVAAVDRNTEQVKQTESRLAEARATEAGARAANLISLVDSPDTGTRPLGPGKTVIVGAGFMGGLMLGLGALFLTVPANAETSSKASVGWLSEAVHDPRRPRRANVHDQAARGTCSKDDVSPPRKRKQTCVEVKPSEKSPVRSASHCSLSASSEPPCRKKLTLTQALAEVAERS